METKMDKLQGLVENIEKTKQVCVDRMKEAEYGISITLSKGQLHFGCFGLDPIQVNALRFEALRNLLRAI